MPAWAQTPTWSDFYMSKVGSYYALNVYKTPIRGWMTPDTSQFAKLGQYVKATSPDTAAGDYSLWLGHYGTRVDSSGVFFFPFPIKNSVDQGWSMGTEPWNNIKQENNTVFDIQLENGAAFSVDQGKGRSGDGGFRIYRHSVGQDSFYATISLPLSFFRSTRKQLNHADKTHKYPLAVYSVGGDTLRVAVCDTNQESPIQVFKDNGSLGAYFGRACSTGYVVTDSTKCRNYPVEANPDSAASIRNGVLCMAAWPTDASKKAFGNSAANLRDTILYAGAKTDSTICSPAYIYDSGATTFNSLMYRVRPDTIFTIRQAATDPDSFSIIIVKKK